MQQRKSYIILAATALAAFLVAIDFTIVNTCLPAIQHGLMLNNRSLQWIMTGFGISFCSALVIAGRLTDVFGKRFLFYIGVIVFLVSSLGAAMAHNLWQLTCMRFIQGFAGAIVFPSSMAIAADSFTEDYRARVMGIFGSILGCGLAIGPVLGGLITSAASWRWIFLINIPTLLVCLSLAIPTLKSVAVTQKSSEAQRVAWSSACLLMLGLLGVLVYINQAPLLGWGSHYMLLSLAVGIISIIWLCLRERAAKDTLLPYKLFQHKKFMLGTFYFLATISTCWSVLLISPLYLHKVLAFDIRKVGYYLSIMSVLTFIVPGIAGYCLHHYPEKRVLHIGFLINTLALFLLSCLGVSQITLLIIAGFVLYGIAWGTGNAFPVPVAMGADSQQTGVISGAVLAIGNIGSVVLLTLANLCLWQSEKWWFQRHLLRYSHSHAWYPTPSQLQSLHTMLARPDRLQQLMRSFPAAQHVALHQLVQRAFVFGVDMSFLLLMIFSVCCWLLSVRAMRGGTVHP